MKRFIFTVFEKNDTKSNLLRLSRSTIFDDSIHVFELGVTQRYVSDSQVNMG